MLSLSVDLERGCFRRLLLISACVRVCVWLSLVGVYGVVRCLPTDWVSLMRNIDADRLTDTR